MQGLQGAKQKIEDISKSPLGARLLQFIKFGIVGFFNTLLNYAVYSLCVKVGLHYLFANACGFIISVLSAYYFNGKFVFHNAKLSKKERLVSLVKTYAVYAFTGLLLNSFLLYLLVKRMGVSEYLAPLLCLFVTVPLNFLLNKYWAMREKK